MLTIVLGLGWMGLAALSLWGWGSVLLRLVRLPPRSPPVTVAIGLAVMVGVGGILNVAHAARPVAVDAVLAAGVVAAAILLVPVVRRPRRWPGKATLVALSPLVFAGGFALRYLWPQAAFNHHDDFEKYFALPVRMLATGTLSPNPFGSVGVETLGGQAWLHAFVAAHFPLAYLGAVDGWFGLLLCMAVVAAALPPGRWGLGAAAAATAVWLIDPMVVNVSAVFSGAALVAAALLWGAAGPERDAPLASGLILGLLYAALVALKGTFAIFVGIHVLVLLTLGGWGRGAGWRVTAGIAAGAAAALISWIVLQLSLFLASRGPPTNVPTGLHATAWMFSVERTNYGVAELSYLLVGVVVLGLGLVLVVTQRWRKDPAPVPPEAIGPAALTTGLCFAGFLLVGAPLWFGPLQALRYACPVLIGAVPVLLRLAEPRRGELGVVAASVVLALVFLPATVERPLHEWRDRSPLAYLGALAPEVRQDYLAYSARVLAGEPRARLAAIQQLVPAGTPFASWVSAPFLLDFRRNPILTVDPAGLAMDWARWPPGLQYFLLEYRGYAVRGEPDYRAMESSAAAFDGRAAVRARAFLQELHRRADSAEILYNDGSVLLFRSKLPE